MRKFLGAFLFGKDEVRKKTKVLSGGERNRVSMVKVLLQDANFLLLDEPTNHLDIPSKDILLRALSQFEGTMLFVSHDHYFVNKLATRVLELNKDGIRSYFGNYDSYLAQKHDAERIHEEVDSVLHPDKHVTAGKANNINNFEIKKTVQKHERKIINLEKDIEMINESFADIEYGTDAFSDAQNKLNKLEKELKGVTSEWEKALAKAGK
jgi:ATP-binding cassette subfamily F protein 3